MVDAAIVDEAAADEHLTPLSPPDPGPLPTLSPSPGFTPAREMRTALLAGMY